MQTIELPPDQEILDDYQDLQLLRQAKKERANDPLISFEDMKKEFLLSLYYDKTINAY